MSEISYFTTGVINVDNLYHDRLFYSLCRTMGLSWTSTYTYNLL